MIDNRKIVEFAQLADAAVKKASAEIGAARSAQAAATKRAAAVKERAAAAADSLIAAGQYKEAQRADVVAALCDHQRALGYIAKTAERLAARPPESIGRAEAPMGKAAAAGDPQAQAAVEKESDRAWRRAMDSLPSRLAAR